MKPSSGLDTTSTAAAQKGLRRRWITASVLGLIVISSAAFIGKSLFQARISSLFTSGTRPFQPDAWAWKSEEHWAVDQSVRDIAEILLFSAGEKPETYRIAVNPDAASPHSYTINIQGPRIGEPLNSGIRLQNHLWDPADFRGLALELKSRLKVTGDHAIPSQSGELLQVLLTPAPIEIEKAQALASKQLTQHPGSFTAQEDAAAVLAILGLYNQSGHFQDDRFLLCRMSAHLALAEALRPEGTPSGPSGTLASIALKILIQHSLQAVQDLDALRSSPSPSLPAPWINALYMLATTDWRPVSDPVDASSAEALASYEGRWFTQDAEKASQWIEKDARKWETHRGFLNRLALSGSYSVDLGHAATNNMLERDLQDFQAVWRLSDGRILKDAEICRALNTIPERSYDASKRQLTVVGKGIWARHFQAILLDDMTCTIHFLAEKFGSKEARDEYWSDIQKRYSDLEQFPLLQKRFAHYQPSLYGDAILKAAALAQAHPELISDSSFVCIARPTNISPLPQAMPKYEDWLAVPEPYGTRYNPWSRTNEMKEVSHRSAQEWAALIRQNPYCHWYANRYLRTFKKGTLKREDVEFAYSHIKDFNRGDYLLRLIECLPETDPEAIRLMRECAAQDPDRFVSLGRMLVKNRQEKEAAEAYLNYFHRCEDRVAVSNNVGWLVTYLWKTGQKSTAEEVASDAARTYSARGLEIMAHLRELQNRPEEAEDYYRKEGERYDSPEAVLGLYFRWKDRQPAFRTKWEKAIGATFPGGLKRFDPSLAPVHPAKGMKFGGRSARLEEAGIKPGAIVVAVEGYLVENQRQYLTVRSLSLEDPMSLVVFQDGKYQTLATDVPGRRFGVDLVDYP